MLAVLSTDKQSCHFLYYNSTTIQFITRDILQRVAPWPSPFHLLSGIEMATLK